MYKVLLAATASVVISHSAMAQKEKNETLEGNGKVITRDISITSFDALKASGVYELKLTQGNKESVKIEADENLQEYFTVKNEGNCLKLNHWVKKVAQDNWLFVKFCVFILTTVF